MPKLPIKPQFVREFRYADGLCELRDSRGEAFLTVSIDKLTPDIARQMCLQQLVRAVTDQAVESMRLGVPESEAKAAIMAAYERILAGEYRPRTGKSPNGIRKAVSGIILAARAAFDAGYRSVSHGGQTYQYQSVDEAVLALQWLRQQPADANGVTGRQVYLDITRQPEIRSRMAKGTAKPSLARQALGVAPARPLPSPS